jgi:IclR helix-turn-helix domain
MKISPSNLKISTLVVDRVRRRDGLFLEEVSKSRPRVATRNCESYIVPMVAKAIDISELLQEFSSGLQVRGIAELTGYSVSTIYRILRTLAAFGYVVRDSNGFYRMDSDAPKLLTRAPDQKRR